MDMMFERFNHHQVGVTSQTASGYHQISPFPSRDRFAMLRQVITALIPNGLQVLRLRGASAQLWRESRNGTGRAIRSP